MNSVCKVCGKTTTEWSHLRMASLYYYCSACEFISKDETMCLPASESLAIYNTHVNSIDDVRYVTYFKKFIESAILPVSNGSKIGLDFGSGPSAVLSQILTRDYGYEMDIYDLHYAPEKSYIGKKYDMITSTEVAEHIEQPLAYFKLLKSCLTDTGTLSIKTQFHRSNSLHFSDWHYVRDKTHVGFYTEKTMATIAKKVGLKVVYTNHTEYTTFMIDDQE